VQSIEDPVLRSAFADGSDEREVLTGGFGSDNETIARPDGLGLGPDSTPTQSG